MSMDRWITLAGRPLPAALDGDDGNFQVRVAEATAVCGYHRWVIGLDVQNPRVCLRGWAILDDGAKFGFEAEPGREGSGLVWGALTGGRWAADTSWLLALNGRVSVSNVKERLQAFLGECVFCTRRLAAVGDDRPLFRAMSYRHSTGIHEIPSNAGAREPVSTIT